MYISLQFIFYIYIILITSAAVIQCRTGAGRDNQCVVSKGIQGCVVLWVLIEFRHSEDRVWTRSIVSTNSDSNFDRQFRNKICIARLPCPAKLKVQLMLAMRWNTGTITEIHGLNRRRDDGKIRERAALEITLLIFQYPLWREENPKRSFQEQKLRIHLKWGWKFTSKLGPGNTLRLVFPKALFGRIF